jgi:hypothetical protein
MNKILLIALLISTNINADTLNPCEYMNINGTTANKLDTGQDENFERIKQHNNRELIMECQRYEIARIRAANPSPNIP